MASGPISSWEIDGETVETVSYFIFLGSKITAVGDCSHEIKRWLLLGRKVMTSLGSIFKSRDIALLTKVRLVKAMVFPVVMYGCESWSVKKAECWALSQLFHSPLSLSSRGFEFLFTFCHKGGVICISEVIDISSGNFDSSLCFFQPSVSHDVFCI